MRRRVGDYIQDSQFFAISWRIRCETVKPPRSGSFAGWQNVRMRTLLNLRIIRYLKVIQPIQWLLNSSRKTF